MPYLQSNIPHFKCWVRREYTCNHDKYHGEFLHAMAIAVTTMPNRCLSFQVIFTGCETDGTKSPNVHGGAMWARMPTEYTPIFPTSLSANYFKDLFKNMGVKNMQQGGSVNQLDSAIDNFINAYR